MGIFSRKKIIHQPIKEEKPIKEIKAAVAGSEQVKSVSKHLSFLLKQNWATEKSAGFESERKYIFIVDKNANKPQIKKAVEAVYGVKVSDINIINQKSKVKRFGRTTGIVPGKKKAVITLKEGSKINF